MPIIHYLITSSAALLTLALFDSNPWWIVLIYAIIPTSLNYWLPSARLTNLLALRCLGQGMLAAILAYLFGLTPFFRTTFGTLVGFALLLSLAQCLYQKIKKE